MTDIVRTIAGGDYASAGKASRVVKEALKRLGVEPAIVRRAMVAVYEAEMNVVIHAHNGVLRAALTPERLDVTLEDEGPGIPDIAQAMREGYSTAPDEARALGFGAGMGLPNIRKNTDRFSIQSESDKGTRLRFSLLLLPQADAPADICSLRVDAGRCVQCMRCLSVCPTQAIRIRKGRPTVSSHLCVDCTSCARVCPANVFSPAGGVEMPEAQETVRLLLPAAALGQYGFSVSEETMDALLRAQGWAGACFLDPSERALEARMHDYSATHPDAAPVLSPVCPAVINLIRTRYPSLLGHVPPFLTAVEAALESSAPGRCVFVVSCAAQYAVAKETGGAEAIIVPGPLLRSLTPHVKTSAPRNTEAAATSRTQEDTLYIYGMDRVCEFLDEAENGRVKDCGIVELYACDLGCFGAPVWPEHPAIARRRAISNTTPDAGAVVVYRARPLKGRSGLRLDPDMHTAMEKLAQIDRIVKTLPGRNCSACGSPTCMTLAEDIVMGRADARDCIYSKQDASGGSRPPDKEQTP